MLPAFTGGTPDSPNALRARYQRLTAGAPDPAVSWLNWVIRLRDEGSLTGTVQATISPSGSKFGSSSTYSASQSAAIGSVGNPRVATSTRAAKSAGRKPRNRNRELILAW